MVKTMELEEHINKLKIAYQAFSDVVSLSEMTVCDLAKAAHEQWSLDMRTEYIREHPTKYGGEKSQGNAPWRDEPASTPQKGVLTRAGIAFNPDITKGQASDLIEKLTKGGK